MSVERLPRNDADNVPDVLAIPAWRERVVIGLCAATTLIYEVAITRILSVVLWYHFVFLAVSLAMLPPFRACDGALCQLIPDNAAPPGSRQSLGI